MVVSLEQKQWLQLWAKHGPYYRTENTESASRGETRSWSSQQQFPLPAITPRVASPGLHFGQGRKQGQEILGKSRDPISLPLGKEMQAL